MSISPYRQAVDRFLWERCPRVSGGSCLDVGAAHHRGSWSPDTAIESWTAIDIVPGPDVDHVCSIVATPFRDGRFHLVKATDVLYLLPASQFVDALKEIHRLLAPGGLLVATTPFVRPFSELEDEARWTPPSLGRLLRVAGFERYEIHALGGWWSILVQLIYDRAYHRRPMLRRATAALARHAAALDRRQPTLWALGYGFIAYK